MKHWITGLTQGALILCLFGLLQGCAPGEDAEQKPKEAEEFTTEKSLPYEGRTVVVDAGHGGADPGKVGAGGLTEKEVNLRIAILLQGLLEEEGIKVIMTRTQDVALGDAGASNHKMEDLNTRIAILNEADADLAVSIHQNSFSDHTVRGPQVFYYTGSEEGEAAAKHLQDALNKSLEVARPRVVKANDNYYLLKKSSGVLVIAECAFLSNPEEEALLRDEVYLNRVAEALKEGILAYLD